MKYVIILGDGMADRPQAALGGRTPLQAAATPHMDRIAREGLCGLFRSLPGGVPTSSDVANLSVLGYDPGRHYPGRGPVEAAARGVAMAEGDLVFRCNLVAVRGPVLDDYAGARPADVEAAALMNALNAAFGREGAEFVAGLSYRHLLALRGPGWSADVRCEKPDDHQGEVFETLLPAARSPAGERTASALRSWMAGSRSVLEAHPASAARRASGRAYANMIWPYGGGGVPHLPSFASLYGVKGAVVSAVDVILGIGRLTGMKPVTVPGATGYLDTNYEGKAEAALRALEDHDFVYVHVEAADECSHQGDLEGKLRAIRDLDERLVRILLDKAPSDTRFLLLPDHPVPLDLRRHTRDPVPFALCGPGIGADAVDAYDEISARGGGAGVLQGDALIRLLLG